MELWHYVYILAFVCGVVFGTMVSIVTTLYILEVQRQRARRRWQKDIDTTLQEWLAFANGTTGEALRMALHRFDPGENDG